MRLRSLVLSLALLVTALPASAGVIGNWDGSGRSWNNSSFTNVNALMTAAGNTVRPDEDLITAITGSNVLVVGEPTAAPTGGELTALEAWLRGGGILLLFGDSSGSGAVGNNAIAAAMGTTLNQATNFATFPGTLLGGNFASEGPPHNLVGLTLNSTPASTISGGTALAPGLIHWQAIDSGFVFLFGDRLDHDVNLGAASSVNFRLFENLANRAARPPTPVPEPSATVLALGALLLAVRKSRRVI